MKRSNAGLRRRVKAVGYYSPARVLFADILLNGHGPEYEGVGV